MGVGMGLIAKFASVGGATGASRVLGFAREAAIAALLGAGPVADAFYAAFRFPNLFRRLFAEGPFNAAFVPLFTKALHGEDGRARARALATDIGSLLLVVLIAFSAAAILAMPFLTATVIAPRFADTPEKFDLTVLLARVMFPYLAAMSFAAMLAAVLNAHSRYFLAALAPTLLNAVLIGALALAWWRGVDQPTIGLYLAIGVTISGALQLVLLVVAMRRVGFGFSVLRMPRVTPEVRRFLVLAGPAVLTGGVTQINLVIGQIIASAQDGAIALINYADRVFQLPLGIIGIAIGVVLLPELSRSLRVGDDAEARALQNRSLEFALLLTLPAAAGLVVIPGPILSILFERGAFTPETTARAAEVLRAFAWGLPAFVLVKVFQPVFYAREDMRLPLYATGANVVVNVVLSLLLFPSLGPAGIGMATSAAGWLNAAVLGVAATRRGLFDPTAATVRSTAAIIAGATLMGVALWGAAERLAEPLATGSFAVKAPLVLALVGGAALLHFAVALAASGMGLSTLKGALRRG